MTKAELFENLQWRAVRGEFEVDAEMLKGFLNRDENLRGALAQVLRAADNNVQQLVGVDMTDHSQALRATRLQGFILGLRAAVDLILNSAYGSDSNVTS